MAVPFLCDIARSMLVAVCGPYLALVDYLAVRPDLEHQVLRTLSYIDAVSLGKRAQAPALVSIALRDSGCPPAGPFAAANGFGGETRRVVYRYNDHEGGRPAQLERQIEWLRGTLATKTDLRETPRVCRPTVPLGYW